MTAKEMFEKLGYKLHESYNYLQYVFESEETKDLLFYIEFDTDIKKILIDCNRKDYINDLSMQELQAINKQIEELGWNNE